MARVLFWGPFRRVQTHYSSCLPSSPGRGQLPNEGSERESDRWAILGCFLEGVNGDEFDVCRGHPLGLQQQVAEILITAAAIDQHANIPVHRLDYAEANLGPTVVQNAVQVLD